MMSWYSFDVWSFMTMTMMIRMINWWRFMTVVIVYDDVVADHTVISSWAFQMRSIFPTSTVSTVVQQMAVPPSSNERTIFVSTEDVQSTPATCSDAFHALWLLLNFPGKWDLVGTPEIQMDHDGSTATGWNPQNNNQPRHEPPPWNKHIWKTHNDTQCDI